MKATANLRHPKANAEILSNDKKIPIYIQISADR